MIEALADRGLSDVIAVDRPCTGDLQRELAFLGPYVDGAVVVGQSGGATLALALAASEHSLAGAVCHEPAVGRLAPTLLAPFAAAYAQGGVAAFGRALYGPSWSIDDAGEDSDAAARDLPMFRAFEPDVSRQRPGSVLVTVGSDSPTARHDAARALHDELGYPTAAVAGAHFVARDAAADFARIIDLQVREIVTGRTPPSGEGVSPRFSEG